jgi:hypothetical protein
VGPHPPPLRLNLFASAPSRARRQVSLRKAPPVEEDEPTRSPTAVVRPSTNSSPPDSTPANPSQNSPSAHMPVSGPSASSSPPDGPQRRTRSSKPSPSRPSPPLSLTEISSGLRVELRICSTSCAVVRSMASPASSSETMGAKLQIADPCRR